MAIGVLFWVIMIIGLLFGLYQNRATPMAWVGKRSGGLLAPYTAHMTLDWLMDPII